MVPDFFQVFINYVIRVLSIYAPGLYNKGLIYFDVPVKDDDYIIGMYSVV